MNFDDESLTLEKREEGEEKVEEKRMKRYDMAGTKFSGNLRPTTVPDLLVLFFSMWTFGGLSIAQHSLAHCIQLHNWFKNTLLLTGISDLSDSQLSMYLL